MISISGTDFFSKTIAIKVPHLLNRTFQESFLTWTVTTMKTLQYNEIGNVGDTSAILCNVVDTLAILCNVTDTLAILCDVPMKAVHRMIEFDQNHFASTQSCPIELFILSSLYPIECVGVLPSVTSYRHLVIPSIVSIILSNALTYCPSCQTVPSSSCLFGVVPSILAVPFKLALSTLPCHVRRKRWQPPRRVL